MGHARALLALPDRRQQAEVATLIAKKGLSVRETEGLVSRLRSVGKPAAETATRDLNVERLERALAETLGTDVAIKRSAEGGGRLVVSYNSLDEVDALLRRLTSRH